MRTTTVEQRKELRNAARGRVRMADPTGIEFAGRLLDTSPSGFRAAHANTALSSGQRVRFSHSGRRGHAVVMWNRILQDQMESGFFVVSE
jgi:hypothetical protein